MLLLVVLTLTARAACPASPSALAASLDSAEAAFNELDSQKLHKATEDAQSQADCLTAPIDAATAARLHRAVGLRAFVDGDQDSARLSFAAARAADPAFVFPEDVLPRNHPARALYDQASQVAPVAMPAAPPSSGTLEFDGAPSLSRPAAWPTVAVLVGDRGEAAHSAYLSPGEPLFPYSTGRAGPTARMNVPLAVTAGVSLAAAGVLYGAARSSFDRFWDEATPTTELEGLQSRTNGLFYGSMGAAALGVAAGVGVFTVHWR